MLDTTTCLHFKNIFLKNYIIVFLNQFAYEIEFYKGIIYILIYLEYLGTNVRNRRNSTTIFSNPSYFTSNSFASIHH